MSQISGEVVQATTFVLQNTSLTDYRPTFVRAVSGDEEAESTWFVVRVINIDQKTLADFKLIPGSPIAYWASQRLILAFSEQNSIADYTISDGQNKTSNNAKYVRFHWEVDSKKIGRNKKWLPNAKGGQVRKWYGNIVHVVDWSDEARDHYRTDASCRIVPEYLWYKPGICWTLLAGLAQSFRLLPVDATFDMTGSAVFMKDDADLAYSMAFLNSKTAAELLRVLNPTLALQIKDVRNLPLKVLPEKAEIEDRSDKRIDLIGKTGLVTKQPSNSSHTCSIWAVTCKRRFKLTARKSKSANQKW